MTASVLLVEDDAAVREALAQTIELADLAVTTASSFVAARDRIRPDFDGVVLSDVRMPGRDGFHLLAHARAVDPDLPVILLTGEGDVPSAVRGISEGALAFLEKPCEPAELVATLRRGLSLRAATLAARAARGAQEGGDAAARMLFGVSAAAERLRAAVRAVARAPGPVLVHGEPGTGTSKVAEVIHLMSPRAGGPFVRRMAPGLGEAALTEALERARGGSLLVDGVEALPRETQMHLAAGPEDGPRLLAASNLSREALARAVDPELFLRLDAMPVRVPSLRERPADIPVLYARYLAQACEQADLPLPEVRPEMQARLMAREWPGNARALMNAAMRHAMGLEEAGAPEGGLVERMREVERSILVDALRRHEGRAAAAAEALELPRKTFYDKLARHDLRPDDYRR